MAGFQLTEEQKAALAGISGGDGFGLGAPPKKAPELALSDIDLGTLSGGLEAGSGIKPIPTGDLLGDLEEGALDFIDDPDFFKEDIADQDLLDQGKLDTREELLSDRKDMEGLLAARDEAIVSGDPAAQLKADQDLLALTQLNKAVSDQEDAFTEAKRALFRQTKEAEALGLAYDRSQVTLERESSMIARQVGIASRGADQAAAEAANVGAQGGFGSNSALLGFAASAKSQAATNAGDVATNRVGLASKFVDLQAARDNLILDIEDTKFNQDNLAAKFDTNTKFLFDTFDLGGDIQGSMATLQASNLSAQQLAAEKSAGFSTALAGVGVAAMAAPWAPLVGGALIVKGLADYFDF